jgi:hypothetical protein
VIEFDCVDCGRHIYNFGIEKTPEPPLCATCLHLPNWFDDPKLRKILDPEYEGSGQ